MADYIIEANRELARVVFRDIARLARELCKVLLAIFGIATLIFLVAQKLRHSSEMPTVADGTIDDMAPQLFLVYKLSKYPPSPPIHFKSPPPPIRFKYPESQMRPEDMKPVAYWIDFDDPRHRPRTQVKSEPK